MSAGVLITRPAHQAEALMELAREQGYTPVSLPLLAIQPLDIDAGELEQAIRWAQNLVFISENAVRNLVRQLASPALLQDKTIIAIGKKTTRVLQELGIPVSIQPDRGHTSEDLLQHSGLDQTNIQKQKFLIVRGEGGRETLARTLQARGAETRYLEVYRRVLPEYDRTYLEQLIRQQPFDAILVTSEAALQHLLQLYQGTEQQQILGCQLVVPSQRIAATAQQAGFRQAILVARSAADNDMLGALQARA